MLTTAGKGAVAGPPRDTGLTVEKRGPGLVSCHNVLLSWLKILFRAVTTATETGHILRTLVNDTVMLVNAHIITEARCCYVQVTCEKNKAFTTLLKVPKATQPKQVSVYRCILRWSQWIDTFPVPPFLSFLHSETGF